MSELSDEGMREPDTAEPLRSRTDTKRSFVVLSTRAIAPIVGASIGTVHADRSEVFRTEHVDAEPRQITGRDGKTYSAPSPGEGPR